MNESYPLFIPPEALLKRPRTEWTKSESEAYLAWLLQVMDERIARMLSELGVSTVSSPEVTLSLVGQAALERFTNCPELQSEDKQGLSDAGLALAADIGLLVARLLLESAPGKISWRIERSAKRDAFYNLPVLAGFGKLRLDPIGGSIAEASALVKGSRNGDIWLEGFRYWARTVPG